jgi:C4-dicarboxylate transporter, DctM subunit
VLMLLYMVAVWATALWQPQKVGQRVHYPWPERLRSLLKVVPVLGLFVLVLGGLYIGIFTPTESAGVGAFGGFVFMVLRGRANWATVREALAEAALLTAMLLPVTIGAGIFTNFLTIAGLTSEAAAWVQGLPVPPMGIVVAICLIYIVLGCVFDGLAMIFLTVPIFFPIITALQLDPIWFGIIVVIVVELGLITPPMGMNVFVVQGLIPDVSTWRMFANVGAFVVAALVCLGLVLAWPQLALWLPSLMR